MKRNYKMTIRYDGTRYFGWERQPGKEHTIQGKLETLLTRMLEAEREAASPKAGEAVPEPEPVNVIGAGRTDAGVHAKAMVANVILDTKKSEDEIRAYMNRYLPDNICVDELKVCADRFHARFKAKGKTYCYSCWAGEGKPVFDRRYVTVLDVRPDVAKMREAAEYLLGTHDFKSFCGNAHMKKSTVRTIDSIDIKARNPYIRFYIHGNSFLQHMVRIIVGTLLEVGYGRMRPEDVPAILKACDRTAAGPTAPAQGLMLLEVEY